MILLFSKYITASCTLLHEVKTVTFYYMMNSVPGYAIWKGILASFYNYVSLKLLISLFSLSLLLELTS